MCIPCIVALGMLAAGDVCARARPEPARRELTEAERETFWRQGFLTVPGLFTKAELQELDDHSRALADGSIRMKQPSGAGIDEHEFPEELDGPDSRASLEENRFFRYIQQHRNIPLHEHYLEICRDPLLFFDTLRIPYP